jgi:hypothetical protein
MKIILACAALALTSARPSPGLGELSWLRGDWVSETPQGWTEEHWTAERGGMMLGTNRSGKGDKARDFEFMRIQRDEQGRVVFWASPGGKTAVPFLQAGAAAGQKVVFENSTNDYPQRIVYERRGKVLTGTISDIRGANAFSWSFRRR